MDASYFSFLRTNDFRCVFRYYYGVNSNTAFVFVLFVCVRSAMRAASQLPGRGPKMWIMPLHLHVNQKSDYDMI